MKPRTVFFSALSAIPAGAVPFFATVKAWPEVIVPAYFMTRGGVLYQTIFFPHTPLLISIVAALGGVLGLSAVLFRSILAVAMAATAALIAAGLEKGKGFPIAVTVGVLLSVLWESYMEGLAIWPDSLLAPVILGSALLLERFDASGSRLHLIGGGFLLGLAVLVKQTSVWISLAALLWMFLRRKRFAEVTTLSAAITLPYALFLLLWGAAFRTTSHLYWTLVVPLFSSLAHEVRLTGGLDDVHESLAPFLVIPSLLLLDGSFDSHRRSPMPLMIIGTIGMAWPRGGLLHLSAAVGLFSFLGARAVLRSADFLAFWRRRSPSLVRLASVSVGAAMLVTSIAVAALSGGSLLLDGWGGRVFYWDDPLTTQLQKEVSARVPPGGRVLLYNVRRDNLYASTSTLTPNGLYVNSSFWYCLNKNGVSARVMDGLEHFPGWILFRDVDRSESNLRETDLYRFLSSHTLVIGTASDDMTWRKIKR